ncbi:unnamed protein product [Moneuplotes crassus]|uniref:Uncharacterized protein n=1 Tax=Euplotes crassus TaxID=5936 RepID=A0AAD2D139_EUPCR|nr:unnamed protein product [Moneuplotes crassus]
MTDKDYKNSLIDLLARIPNYFNQKSITESMRLIKVLDNLGFNTCQSSRKFSTRPCIQQRGKHIYCIRNLFSLNKIATSQILELCVHCSIGDYVDNMEYSNKAKLSFDELNNITNELKATKAKFSLRGLQLKDEIKNYARTTYSLIKNML